MNNIFAIRGNICFSKDVNTLYTAENSYIICENGICQGVFEQLPEKYQNIPCKDYGDRLIIPGLVDLHMHAPQYAFRALALDLELLEWLNKYAFKVESEYADIEYAKNAYEIFADDLVKSGTTRICLFGTLHTEATLLLMEMLEKSGMRAYVGKVNMDRNSPDYLCEESADKSAADTKYWIEESIRRFKNIKPIITPRFTPSCSDELMAQLGELQRAYHLPVQSHLSENYGEIAWVQELCPNTRFYGEAYDQFGMFGTNGPSIMAHCVHSSEEEMELMKKRGVFVAHCPQSNANLSSGIAPAREYLERGINIGLGCDIGGGTTLNMFRCMCEAIQYSKVRWRLVDQTKAPLRLEEVFHMATKGGGAFFGKVGSFEAGYEFDALVIDDSVLRYPRRLDIKERVDRLIYMAEDNQITAKYVAGTKLFDKSEA